MRWRRGDVVLIDLPNSDLVTSKRRPAIVVQADGLDTGLPQVMIAMITTNRNRGGTMRVPLDLGSAQARSAGLREDSIVMADVLATVRLDRVGRTVGRLADMSLIDAALRAALGL